MIPLPIPQKITQHLKAIFAEGELHETATCKNCLQVQSEGNPSVSRHVKDDSLAAVTGKIDVRNWKPPADSEASEVA